MRNEPRSRRTAITIATVSVSGGALLGASLFTLPPLTTDLLIVAGVLTIVTAIAEMVAIGVTHGDEGEMLTLFELAVVADIVLLPASVAVVVSALGLAIALAIGRKPFVKFAFNIGQYTLGVVPAVMAFHTFGHGDFASAEGLIALVAGMAVFTFINLATISWIIAATTGRSMEEVFREEGGLSFAMGLGNSAVGIVAVALWLERPALVAAVLAPAVAMHLAFRGWIKQKELLGQMREEKTKLDRILEHSTEGIVLADADGLVLLWSPSMERITGVSAGEAVGKALPYLLRGRDVVGQPMAVGVEQAAGEPTEIEVIAADGTGRWLRLLHGPGFDEHGKLSFDVLVVHDVTRQREVDRLKDDFISTVSHELRTPLTPIKAFASLLLRRGHEIEEPRRREALSSIVERSDHMHRLVEDLLLASRMANPHEKRLPEVDRRPVDAEGAVDKVLRSFRVSHPTRDFILTADDNVVAMADPLRLEQIVANLVSNAVKFSDDGTRVDVDVARVEHDIRIRVRDQGRGIPADKTDEIFERFSRLEDPLRMTTGGAGLGLFIVKRLAQALGGHVEVTSEVGVGSTFTVMLPAAAARPGDHASADLAV